MNTFKKGPRQTPLAAICGILSVSVWLIAVFFPWLHCPLWAGETAPPSACGLCTHHQAPSLHQAMAFNVWSWESFEPTWLLIWQNYFLQYCFSAADLGRHSFHASLLPWEIWHEFIFQNKCWSLVQIPGCNLPSDHESPSLLQRPPSGFFWPTCQGAFRTSPEPSGCQQPHFSCSYLCGFCLEDWT